MCAGVVFMMKMDRLASCQLPVASCQLPVASHSSPLFFVFRGPVSGPAVGCKRQILNLFSWEFNLSYIMYDNLFLTFSTNWLNLTVKFV
jgi:hypothetical protein